MINYRPDIDGLRAIAVLSVLIYHAQFDFGNTFFLSGGYLGVDVFFVISGFLITSILLKEIIVNQLSFKNFYMRRARRILPALLTVMTCTLPFAWLHLLPAALKDYAGSLVSSLLFSSNIWFWLKDGYTAEHSLYKPLLHTWSLSVEEQFYVLFPIALLVAWRLFGKHLVIFLAVVFCLSLALAQFLSADYNNTNFFLLPSRMWELITGAFLAYFYHVRRISPQKIVFAGKPVYLALIGLILVLVPIYFYNDKTPHPSLLTVFPVLGSALIIWFSHPEDPCTKLLSCKPVVAIGKWSYSLYLWHYPVFAFSRVTTNENTSIDKIAWIATSVILAFISYKLIEQPARNPNKIKPRLFFVLISLWSFGLLYLGVYWYQSNGFPERLGSIQTLIEETKVEPVMKDGRSCAYRSSGDACLFRAPNNAPTLINAGDSHAYILAKALKNISDRHSYGYMELTQSACPLLLDAFGFNDNGIIGNCHPPSQAKRLDKIREFSNAVVVYSARFPLYFSGQYFDNQLGGKEVDIPSWMTPDRNGKKHPELLAAHITKTVQALLETNNTIVIVYPIPEAGWHVPRYIKNELRNYPPVLQKIAFKNKHLTTRYDVFLERSKKSYEALDSLGIHKNLIRIYPAQALCNAEKNECLTHDESHLFYADENHLSPHGAALVAKQIEIALLGISK